MKKLLALLLVGMLCLSLAACGDKEDDKKDTNDQNNDTSDTGGMPVGEDPTKDDINWDI